MCRQIPTKQPIAAKKKKKVQKKKKAKKNKMRAAKITCSLLNILGSKRQVERHIPKGVSV